ncbi:MAG: DEAD/DEAH box helicase, partial [Planctomycetes bacterium]|nr:DEAD/DEAH box helicase [Planctomycetota bacterium]
MPFWRGEAPGRTIELSEEVSKLREELDERIGEAGNPELGVRNEEPFQTAPKGATGGLPTSADHRDITQHGWTSHPCHPESSTKESLVKWLVTETRCSPFAAEQVADYAAAQKAAIGLLPTQRRIVFERFFDESGGMQMVIHAPFGSRITKAWGFAMRKRFCRSFDFELQATADDDGFILSLGPQHSFPLESMFPMLNENNVQPLLEQAVLAAPMFGLRWRWNVTRALLVLRMQNGKKVPPAFQRFRAEDLLTAVFPRITGCLEEHTGDIDIPDHPLVKQTMDDCLHEAMDIDALKQIFSEIEQGTIQLIARDTREPSPFSYELLNANPYAFLDGGELQERRARAVSSRRSLTVESVDDLGKLDPNAIHQVQLEAHPLIRNADELHDALLSRIILPVNEAAEWFDWYRELSEQHRVATITLLDGSKAWVAAERIPAALSAFPSAASEISIAVPEGVELEWTSTDARVAIVRGLIEISGPITSDEIAARVSFTPRQCSSALEALEGEGVVLRGHFTPRNHPSWSDKQETLPHADQSQSSILNPQSSIEWCHRRLLARIHRLTMQGLRAQIQPVGVDVYMRFLFRHHGLLPTERRSGSNGLFEVIAMLQGIDVPIVSWERDLLPARIAGYQPGLLDELCLSGDVGWGRLFPPKRDPHRSRPMASLTRVAPISLVLRSDLDWLSAR